MKLRMIGLSAVLVLALAVTCFAGVCPRCGAQTAEGEKYCAYHKGMELEQQKRAADEQKLVESMKKARKEYEEGLNALVKFYQEAGLAPRYERAKNELEDYVRGRHYQYQDREDTWSRFLKPKRDIPAAQELYDRAERLYFQVLPPWGKEKRKRDAVNLYTEVIEEHPDSNLIDECAFRLGELLEGLPFIEYERAAHCYEYCFLWNPETELPARYRAGLLYEQKLGEYQKAAEMYYLESKLGTDIIIRKQAELRLEALQNKGFGRDLGKAAPKAAPAPDKEAPKADK